ncbi:mitochondrial import inner membrane translocase subunit tim22 [Phaffia rhodozyma]|uniref:Mitochondrial import inner membrane translocase subunit TIM22 n=1 Tax=Phaffia rhodozyma TaxID=264483 RepID=A0A0F7SS62_PHARH|nr:mitochondrial import inner membrane translocase subunit tim22 [Phaffia rhodozyma]
MSNHPLLPPIFPAGREPVPPGTTEEELANMRQMTQLNKLVTTVPESCIFKTVLSAGAGFGLGAFFSLMSTSFQYEDPMNRANVKISTMAQTKLAFKDMGVKMWGTGKGFAKVGAIYSGVECCVEGYRAKNDIQNSLYAGMIAGSILALQTGSGPKAVLGGGIAFAAFSGAIDLYMRKEAPDED